MLMNCVVGDTVITIIIITLRYWKTKAFLGLLISLMVYCLLHAERDRERESNRIPTEFRETQRDNSQTFDCLILLFN